MSATQHSNDSIPIRLQRIDDQIGRIISEINSEKGTHNRVHTDLYARLKEFQDEFKSVMYGHEGVIVHLDRLNEDKKSRHRMSQRINAIAVTVSGILIKIIIDVFREN